MTDEIYARCVDCRGEFTEAQILNSMACPSCGSQGIPMSPSKDVTIKINWHELRILCIWAEQWAGAHTKDSPGMAQTIESIAKPLQAQYPSYDPLLLSWELGDLAKHYEIEVGGNIQPKDRDTIQ